MPKPKKNSIALHINANADVMRRFEEYCTEMGQTKTLAFERIIGEHLDLYDAKKKPANINNQTR